MDVYQKDFSKEAKIILNFISELQYKYQGNIYATVRQTLDLMKGKKNDFNQ